jgi:hypothetical protein
MSDSTGFVQSIKDIRVLIDHHKSRFPDKFKKFDDALEIEFIKYPYIDRYKIAETIDEINFLKDEFDSNYIPDISGDPATKPFDYVRDLSIRIKNYLNL